MTLGQAIAKIEEEIAPLVVHEYTRPCNGLSELPERSYKGTYFWMNEKPSGT